MATGLPLPADGRPALVHHRKLNSRSGLEDTMEALRTLPALHHVAEGDLCWDFTQDRELLYFHHPDLLLDTGSSEALDKAMEGGRLWTLEAALSPAWNDLFFIVELKTGRGPREAALKKALGLLEAARTGRYWVDTFSLQDIRLVKSLSPGTCTSLHTKVLAGGVLLKTAMEFPPLSLRRVTSLSDVDVVTVTYNTSPQRWLPVGGFRLDREAERLRTLGRELVCGGVLTPDMHRLVVASGVRAGYIKFDWRLLGAGT
jgi:hypothetical protein